MTNSFTSVFSPQNQFKQMKNSKNGTIFKFSSSICTKNKNMSFLLEFQFWTIYFFQLFQILLVYFLQLVALSFQNLQMNRSKIFFKFSQIQNTSTWKKIVNTTRLCSYIFAGTVPVAKKILKLPAYIFFLAT